MRRGSLSPTLPSPSSPPPAGMNSGLNPLSGGLCCKLGMNGGREGLSPGKGCFPARGPVSGEGCRGTPCLMLPLGRSCDTYRVSRVPWLPAVSSIAYGALSDKDGNKV